MPPVRRATGPGRVNLIGDHTDYNLGVALPMAIGLGVTVEFRQADRPHITVTSTAFEDPVVLPLDLAAGRGGHRGPRTAVGPSRRGDGGPGQTRLGRHRAHRGHPAHGLGTLVERRPLRGPGRGLRGHRSTAGRRPTVPGGRTPVGRTGRGHGSPGLRGRTPGSRAAHRFRHPGHPAGPAPRRRRRDRRRFGPATGHSAPRTTPPGSPSARRPHPSSGPSAPPARPTSSASAIRSCAGGPGTSSPSAVGCASARRALTAGDLVAAGALMTESHRSLADDFEVSTACARRPGGAAVGPTRRVRRPDDRCGVRGLRGGADPPGGHRPRRRWPRRPGGSRPATGPWPCAALRPDGAGRPGAGTDAGDRRPEGPPSPHPNGVPGSG